MNGGKAWSEEDIQLTKEYFNDVYSVGELSLLLKRSKKAVKNKIRQIKKIRPDIPRRRSVSIASFVSEESNMNKELTDMILSSDDRKLFMWNNLDTEYIVDSDTKSNYDWLNVKSERVTAVSIATDVELAKIQLIHEICNTGIWNGTTDSFVEKLNNTKYKEFDLSNFCSIIAS